MKCCFSFLLAMLIFSLSPQSVVSASPAPRGRGGIKLDQSCERHLADISVVVEETRLMAIAGFHEAGKTSNLYYANYFRPSDQVIVQQVLRAVAVIAGGRGPVVYLRCENAQPCPSVTGDSTPPYSVFRYRTQTDHSTVEEYINFCPSVFNGNQALAPNVCNVLPDKSLVQILFHSLLQIPKLLNGTIIGDHAMSQGDCEKLVHGSVLDNHGNLIKPTMNAHNYELMAESAYRFKGFTNNQTCPNVFERWQKSHKENQESQQGREESQKSSITHDELRKLLEYEDFAIVENPSPTPLRSNGD